MRGFLILATAFPLAACASSSDHVTQPGDSIYGPDARKFVVVYRGSRYPIELPGAACNPFLGTYTLTIAGRQFDYKDCATTGSDSNPTYTPRAGSRNLADDEWRALQPRLAALIVSDRDRCAEDGVDRAVIVTTPAGDFEYGDDLYACLNRSGTYVSSEAFDDAVKTIRSLAGN